MPQRPVRIANFSGYLGDRPAALDEVMAGDPADVLMGDYLAEFTLAALAARHQANPERGYVEQFLDQIRPHLAGIARRGCRVVVNAGGFNPAGLAEALRELLAETGVDGLAVAHVDGDNVVSELDSLRAAGHQLRHFDTGAALAEWGHRPIAANAYLGGWGIAAALGAGADIVVCGRVTDASLTAGPAAWWHGWDTAAFDALAGAVLAGHIIECGAHAVGGNFSGFTGVPGAVHPGLPIAEIAADGTSVITKHHGAGGQVTTDTVTAQIVYEIQGPRYLNPDVTVHLDAVHLEQTEPDRVAVGGITGSAPPETTKVSLFAPIGHQLVTTVFATGLDIAEKVALLREQAAGMLDGPDAELDVTALGAGQSDPDHQWAATVPVRIVATCAEQEPLFRLADLLGGLYLSSIPGFYTDNAAGPPKPRPRVDYWPALLSRSVLRHRAVFGDGSSIDVAAPPVAEHVPNQPDHPEPRPHPAVRTRRLPLGRLAHARCGDKGGNSNVGLWVEQDRAWPWLRDLLSTDEFRRLMPEAADLDIRRHELPHLRAVHFVVRGLLGTGGSSNLRVDPIGKAVGEFLRARVVDVPLELVEKGTTDAD